MDVLARHLVGDCAHLLPDLWTGWGTRILWPFSEHRFALDWTGVLDPFVTLPLLAGAVFAWRRRARWRRAILLGLCVSALYIGSRVVVGQVLEQRVAKAHPSALEVRVFPRVIGFTAWRFVAVYPDSYSAGDVSLFEPRLEERRVESSPDGPMPRHVAKVAPVEEAVHWARFPVVEHGSSGSGGTRVEVADLRYHLRGEPTLRFVVEVSEDGEVTGAGLERGGSARELFERWRAPAGRRTR